MNIESHQNQQYMPSFQEKQLLIKISKLLQEIKQDFLLYKNTKYPNLFQFFKENLIEKLYEVFSKNKCQTFMLSEFPVQNLQISHLSPVDQLRSTIFKIYFGKNHELLRKFFYEKPDEIKINEDVILSSESKIQVLENQNEQILTQTYNELISVRQWLDHNIIEYRAIKSVVSYLSDVMKMEEFVTRFINPEK